MPIYEYECLSCDMRFQKLLLRREEEQDLCCPECGRRSLKKLISRVAYHISEQSRLETFDPSVARSDAFYKDTRNIGLAAKKRAQKMGVDLGGEFEARLDRLRTDPGSVIRGG